MVYHPRKKLFYKVFIFLVLLIALFGYMDSVQIAGWHAVDDPNAFDHYAEGPQQVYIGLWFIAFLAIGIMWYWFSGDWSETIGIVLSGASMIAFGLLDIFFFILSPYTMNNTMCWFNNDGALVGKFSELIGHTCTTTFDLWIFGLIGLVISFLIFKYFFYKTPIKRKNPLK